VRLAWTSDLHLDFVDPGSPAYRNLIRQLHRADVDATLVGGDVATADTLARWIERLAADTARPIYFVLGNHDHYGASVAETRTIAARLHDTHPGIVWLDACDAGVEIAPGCTLVGTGGWGDARLGNVAGTTVELNDFLRITDLVDSRAKRIDALRALADRDAQHLDAALDRACERSSRVVVLLHVPPLREACWHDGRPSDEEWLPYFACRALGDVLLARGRSHPDVEMLVLCGHTHGAGAAQPLPNVRVLTGFATYGQPDVLAVISTEGDRLHIDPSPAYCTQLRRAGPPADGA